MEVERQPSPWPCVAMLAALLLLCLLAPRYWHRTDVTNGEGLPSTRDRSLASETVYLPFGWETHLRYTAPLRTTTPPVDPLQIWALPTIQELVAARIGVPRYEQPLEWPLITFPTTQARAEFVPAQVVSPTSKEILAPLATVTLELIGQKLAEFSPVDALPRLSARAVAVHRIWSQQRVAVTPLRSPAARTQAREVVARAPSSLRLLTPVVEAAPAPLVPDPVAASCWCVPQVLLDQLLRLTGHPVSAAWARETLAQLHALCGCDRLDAEEVQPLLEALSDSAEQAMQLAEQTSEERLRVELLRAHWGLARRLDCWAAMRDIRVAERSRERMALHGPISSFFNNGSAPRVATPRASTLITDLETYERSRDPQLGRQVVHQQRNLESSADSLDRSLADSVERHYRNANVRVAITGELLNRMIAREHTEVQALRDRIAGTPVRGRSYVESGSRVRLEPVDGRWQLTVEAAGKVDSNAVADGGPARLHSHTATDFSARKQVLVDQGGVTLQRTIVDANSHNRLVDVTTDFDWVPLLGSFARDRAAAQYRARQNRARAEIELRVSNQAVDQIDRETVDAVERIQRQVRERFTDRLAEAGVDVKPVEMKTTPERLVARLRVAGNHQLGSHTPRPRALSDSLASLQLHETALTNAAVSLSLDGGRFSGPELEQLLRAKFPGLVEEGVHSGRDAVFHFAEEDAIQCRITDGRLEITLSLAALELDGRTTRGFRVHAYYAPVVNGLQAELARDRSLGIEGRLSSSDRARLHNVFNSVLPPEQTLPLLRLENPDDPRLAGLMITQLVLEDGWLGLAVGPKLSERVAERSRSLR